MINLEAFYKLHVLIARSLGSFGKEGLALQGCNFARVLLLEVGPSEPRQSTGPVEMGAGDFVATALAV